LKLNEKEGAMGKLNLKSIIDTKNPFRNMLLGFLLGFFIALLNTLIFHTADLKNEPGHVILLALINGVLLALLALFSFYYKKRRNGI
jgi:RsiW-degrading membrane proteinase PrsW (M82 family)